MNILLDTHILVLREYDRKLERHLLEVARLINDLKYRIVVHPHSIEEVKGDKNIPNRSAVLSKIQTYSSLSSLSDPYDDKDFLAAIQKPKSEREKVDAYLLYSLYKNEVELFLTEDVDIVEKAERLGISERVINLQDAAAYFKKIISQNKGKDHAAPVYSFYRIGQKWFIGEKGKEGILDNLKGFEFIHFLLCNENKGFSPAVVYNGGKSPGDDAPQNEMTAQEIEALGLHPERALYDDQQRKNKSINRLQIESLIEQLKDELNSEDGQSPEEEMVKKDEIKEKIRKLRALSQQMESRRAGRDPKSESEKARINVTKSIRTGLSKIEQDQTISSIARYLNQGTIKTGDTCVYSPNINDKPTWILFQTPSR